MHAWIHSLAWLLLADQQMQHGKWWVPFYCHMHSDRPKHRNGKFVDVCASVCVYVCVHVCVCVCSLSLLTTCARETEVVAQLISHIIHHSALVKAD
jgi:hypothetical protein